MEMEGWECVEGQSGRGGGRDNREDFILRRKHFGDMLQPQVHDKSWHCTATDAQMLNTTTIVYIVY
jgi:hypothetical protein